MNNKVTVQDVINAGYCVSGMREFLKKKNIDYKDFIRNGMNEKDALALNDAMVNRIIQVKNGQQ